MAFNILALDPLNYLPFLKAQLETFGVKFIRQRLGSIEDVAEVVGSTGILVNALGMGAYCSEPVYGKLKYLSQVQSRLLECLTPIYIRFADRLYWYMHRAAPSSYWTRQVQVRLLD